MYIHKKIAITGGPCAGKTSAMQKIVTEFTEKGYKVFVIGETATELINGGIRPFGDGKITPFEFQRCIFNMQLAKEKMYESIANSLEQNTIILCDRGVFDNKAYITDEQFDTYVKENGLNEMDLYNSYDMVIHLVTAAKGSIENYTTENNTARMETAEEAIELDNKTLNAWLGHKRLEIIGNETTFDEKLNRTIKAIYELLGKPYPVQRQYRYLVDKLDINKLKDIRMVKLEIEQIFIESENDETIMIRKTTKDGNSIYSKTVKKDTNISNERIVSTKKISETEYSEYTKINKKLIRKHRYCFTYNNQYYKLDIFEEPEGMMILETDLTNESIELKIPDFIDGVKDITHDIKYRNSYIYNQINKCSLQNSKLLSI